MSHTPKKYTKRPVTVEAVQFTEITKDSVFWWASSIQMNVHPGREDNGNPCLRIPTREGEMTCSLGDWLIRDPFPTDDRKLYPCKPDIFDQTYQPAPEPSEQNDKLTLEDMILDYASIGDSNNGEFKYLTPEGAEEIAERYAAQQVEHATAEAKADAKKGWEYSERLAKLLDEEKGTTAELRKELEAEKGRGLMAVDDCEMWSNKWAQKNIKALNLQNQLSEAQRQRDEALKALKDETKELHELLSNAPIDFLQGGNDIDFADQEEGEFREAISLVMMRVEATISRLSSGETK